MVGSLTFSFVACGDDDDDNTAHNQAGINKSSLYGTWCFEEESTYHLLTFQKDGTGYSDFYIDGWTEEEMSDEHSTFTWTLKGNQLTLAIDGGYVTMTIVSLTKDKMVLTIYDEEENEDYTETFTKVN